MNNSNREGIFEIVNFKDRIIYKEGKIQEKMPINSITKTIVAIGIGICIKKGFINSVKDKAYIYLEKYDIDKTITIEELLTMSSGINWKESMLNEKEKWINIISRQRVILEQKGRFQYGSISSHLLGKIISEVSNKSLEEFMEEHLFKPLGINYKKESKKIYYYMDNKAFESSRTWDISPEGDNIGSYGLRLSANDLLEIGKILIKPNSILPEEYLKKMMDKNIKAENYGYYGYQGWIKDIRGFRTYSAIGIDEKYLTVVPDLDLVLVFLSPLKKIRRRENFINKYIFELLKYIKFAEKDISTKYD